MCGKKAVHIQSGVYPHTGRKQPLVSYEKLLGDKPRGLQDPYLKSKSSWECVRKLTTSTHV